jgi:hypothetical protein
MKHKKVAILNISSLEGETFKNFLMDNPLSGIDFFYFQDKETIFTRSQEGVSLILEEKTEYLLDFPLIIDFKKDRKEKHKLDGFVIYSGIPEKEKMVFYGINHKDSFSQPYIYTPHPLICLLLRFFESFRRIPPKMVFCNTILSTSEEGKEGQDELYNQTISLLNLSSFKKKIYKNQIAFNISTISDQNFQNKMEEEINYFFSSSFPIKIQFVKSGIFFGALLFLNILFSSEKEKKSFIEIISKNDAFEFSSKTEGVVEAVQQGKIFVKIKDGEDLNCLSMIVLADPLYSGMSYNLYNLIDEFFKINNVLKY